MDKDRKKPYTEPIYDKRLLFRHFQGVGAPFRGLSLSPSHLGGGFCIQATLKEQYKVQEFYHYYNMVTKTALKIILIYARDSPAEIRVYAFSLMMPFPILFSYTSIFPRN